MSVEIALAKDNTSLHIPIPGKEFGELKRFFELREQDEEAALTYLEFMEFEGENLNRHYLAAQLAIKLGDKSSAAKHLRFCLSEQHKAKRPELVTKLQKLYEEAFGQGKPAKV